MKITKCLILLSILLFCTATLGAEKKEITVEVTVPESAWTIAIDEVHEVNNELWVVSTVSRDPNIMGAQVISLVRASVKLAVRDLPVKHFVLGKTWSWKSKEPYTFIKNFKQIEKEVKSGKLLYRKSE